MPKTPLKPSPIHLLSQNFDEISVQSQHDSEGGSNTLEVTPTLIPVEEHPDTWILMLSVEIGCEPDSKKPPYLASVRASGRDGHCCRQRSLRERVREAGDLNRGLRRRKPPISQ